MWRRLDLGLRFVYAVAAPILLLPFAKMMPLGGILASTGLATLIALLGSDRWRALVEPIPVLGRLLGGMGQLGDYYRAHPPRPLLYYVLYPVLFPYWLFNREARREFILFRRLNVITLAIIAIASLVEYAQHWRGFPPRWVASAAFSSFALQLVITSMLVMPLVTTVLLLHHAGHRRTLRALAVMMVLTAAFGALAAHFVSDVPLPTWKRLQLRTRLAARHYRACITAHGGDRRGCSQANGAFVALREALNDVYVARRAGPLTPAAARALAVTRLATFYDADEAAAFRLYDAEGILVLYAPYGHDTPIWLARDAHRLITEPGDLPPGARHALRLDR